jgi:Spx/MgsR family transcriptional regulator
MSTMHIILYGIPNCDSVKKARVWFASHSISVQFHDLKKQGVPPEALARWVAAAGWQKLVNRSGTTWRKLDALTQASVTDDESATHLMVHHPSVIKRPVVEMSGLDPTFITVGYAPEQWQAWANVGR